MSFISNGASNSFDCVGSINHFNYFDYTESTHLVEKRMCVFPCLLAVRVSREQPIRDVECRVMAIAQCQDFCTRRVQLHGPFG